jgi:hypothetical protein
MLMKPVLVASLIAAAGCASREVPASLRSGLFRLEFAIPTKDSSAEPPAVGRVLVTIHKNDPDAGPVDWAAMHYEGDLLGRPGSALSTRHRVYSPRKNQVMEVDFDTGLFLREVTPRTVVGEHTPLGFRRFVADQIIVGKPDGSWDWVHLHPTDLTAAAPDPKSATALDPKPVTAPAPRRYIYSEHDVAWVLYEADDRWLSKNPKVRRQAQERYRALLSECSGMDLVKANLERIKERAATELEE